MVPAEQSEVKCYDAVKPYPSGRSTWNVNLDGIRFSSQSSSADWDGGVIDSRPRLFNGARKTLHRPLQYLLLSITSTLFIGFNASMAFISVIFASMSLHSITEVISQPEGKEEDGCAVYNHMRGEWVSQRNLFMVGSTTDLIISTLLFLSLAVYGGFSVRLASSAALIFGFLRFLFSDRFDGWIHRHSLPDS